MKEEELKKFTEWSKKYWYITILNDIVHVRKGRTSKKFKLCKYSKCNVLVEDITNYMSHEKHYGWL